MTYSQLLINGIAFALDEIKKAMNLNNFTLKSQEVVQFAQQLAFDRGHQQIENEHLHVLSGHIVHFHCHLSMVDGESRIRNPVLCYAPRPPIAVAPRSPGGPVARERSQSRFLLIVAVLTGASSGAARPCARAARPTQSRSQTCHGTLQHGSCDRHRLSR